MEYASMTPSRPEAFPAGLRVLVVDDDPTWLKILEKMLRKCSYEVTTCALATVALDILRERRNKFDIVISDVNMPDMDGFKLLEHIGLEMDLPVIMMSIDGETSRVMKGVQHGACDYLLKPVRMKELRNIWQHVYRKKMHEVKEIEGRDIIDDLHVMRHGYDGFEDRNILSIGDIDSPRKRKDMDTNNEHSWKDSSDAAAVKKARVVWSVDLHQKFVNAVNQIGFDKVGPKKILDLMNVPGLTRENVASHLQKYRLYLSRLQKQNEDRSSLVANRQIEFNNGPSENFVPIQQIDSGNSDAPTFAAKSPTNQSKKPCGKSEELKNILAGQLSDKPKLLTSNVQDSQFSVVPPFVDVIPNFRNVSEKSEITLEYQHWNRSAPEMHFMQYPKHDHERCDLLDDYSCLPKSDLERPLAAADFAPRRAVSITCDMSEFKPALLDCIKAISPLSYTLDPASFQVKHESDDSRNVGFTLNKDVSLVQTSGSTVSDLLPRLEPATVAGMEFIPMPEDFAFYSLQGLEIFQHYNSTPVSLQGNAYDAVEISGESSLDYSLMDECLFAA